MDVLSGWKETPEGNIGVTQAEWEHDYPILLERYERACANNPAFSWFGGTITIEDRTYQVC